MERGPAQVFVGLGTAAHSDIVPLDVVVGIAVLAKVFERYLWVVEFFNEQLVIRPQPRVKAHAVDRHVGAEVEIAATAPALADAGSAIGVLGEAAEVGGLRVAVKHLEDVEILVLTEESDAAYIRQPDRSGAGGQIGLGIGGEEIDRRVDIAGLNRGVGKVDQRIGPSAVRRDGDGHAAQDLACGVENLVAAGTLLAQSGVPGIAVRAAEVIFGAARGRGGNQQCAAQQEPAAGAAVLRDAPISNTHRRSLYRCGTALRSLPSAGSCRI